MLGRLETSLDNRTVYFPSALGSVGVSEVCALIKLLKISVWTPSSLFLTLFSALFSNYRGMPVVRDRHSGS